MNEFYIVAGWGIRFLELIVVFFVIFSFRKHSFSLFFGGKSSLKTPADHKMHSCFLTALAVLVFHAISGSLATYMLDIEADNQLVIKLYYFVIVCTTAAYAATLYLLHVIRGCQFTRVARYSLYITLFLMLLNAAQLVLRGYLGNELLYSIYGPATVIANLCEWLIVAKYPFYKFMETRIRQEA